MQNDLIHQLPLELIPGVGSKGVRQLTNHLGSAKEVFSTSKSKLLKIPGIGSKLAHSIQSGNTYNEADTIIQSCNQIGASIYHFSDPFFPKRLTQIHDSPNLIFFKGKGDLNPSKSIAIVGTRKATSYGKKITEQIVSELAQLGVTIISGLAYGIDIQSHKSALSNNIPTVGVIAGGIDRIYPSIHKKYAKDMENHGGILTESIPGTKPDAHLFPARNRIIAGMADATIVVEAAEKGGALITANLADSYNRLVFAIPGDVGNTYSVGANKLIASQKALIYTGVEDLVYHLGWDLGNETKAPKALEELSTEELTLYELIKENTELEIDYLAHKSQISIHQVASTLLSLEFKNLIKSLPGKKYALA